MSESDAPEPESPASSEEAKEDALLFDVWGVSEMEYAGPSVSRYIKATPITHTMGHHASKQFQKPEISITERLINRLMQTGGNTGHKRKMSKIVRDAFEVVSERTKENPVQVLIHTIENVGPHEKAIRLKCGGISAPQAVNVAPQRRVDETLRFIAQDTPSGPYKATTAAAETLARQLIGTADYDVQTYAISQREEEEHVAEAAR